jgi:hypothetical protein
MPFTPIRAAVPAAAKRPNTFTLNLNARPLVYCIIQMGYYRVPLLRRSSAVLLPVNALLLRSSGTQNPHLVQNAPINSDSLH